MTRQRYSTKESLQRILLLLEGKPVAQDAPGTIQGDLLSEDESLSDLAELLASSLPGETLVLPSSMVGALPISSTIQSGIIEIATNAETQTSTDSSRAVVPSGHVYAHQLGIGRERLGSGNNYTEFGSDGHQMMTGTATVWDDLRFASLALKAPASGNPGLAKLRSNTTGTSQGVFLYWFDASSEEELYFAAQMPHAWAGTPIHPHVHWTPAANTTGTVCWGLEYTWAGITGSFPGTQLIYNNMPYTGEDVIKQYQHYLTELPAITGSSVGLSSMLVCRIFRSATGVGKADSCPQDAGLLEVDFHYEINSIGSNQEYVK